MSRDTRDEALDNIQDVANYLLTRNDLSIEISEYLRIIEALARHRDLSHFLDPKDIERLTRINRTNQ